MSILQRQKAKSEEELTEIIALLEGDYKELAEAASEFAQVTAAKEPAKPKFTVYNPNYVTNQDKGTLLQDILDGYKEENPSADSITYQQVKAILKSRYGIETRTIGNFFARQLKEYETAGGNKRKVIVLR